MSEQAPIGQSLLLSAEAGLGKTSALESLGSEVLVISRDSKAFPLKIPHKVVPSWEGVERFIADIMEVSAVYVDRMGKPPKYLAIDSVSQILLDIIERATYKTDSFGSQGKEVTQQTGAFTNFLHDVVEASGTHTILLAHVVPERSDGAETGGLLPFGQGKFKEKGGFFATVNESVSFQMHEGFIRANLRGSHKQARTYQEELPDTMWVPHPRNPAKSRVLLEGEEFFDLKEHMELIISSQEDVGEWSLGT